MIVLQAIMIILLIASIVLEIKAGHLRNVQLEDLSYLEELCLKCPKKPEGLKGHLKLLQKKEGLLTILSWIISIGMICTFILILIIA